MAFHTHSPDYNISHAVQEMAETISSLRNETSELLRLNTKWESDLSFSRKRLGELEEMLVELRSKLSAAELKLKRRGKSNT